MLDDLLARVVDARERVAPNAGPTPVLLKIAPDLSLSDLDDVVGIARSRRVDGMIVGNTTVTRPRPCANARRPRRPAACRAGRCLPLANRMLAETYVRVEGVFPLIGAGGIDSGATRARQNPRRRKPHSSLFRAGVPRPRARRRDQRCAARRARTRPPGQPRRLCRRRRGVGHRRAVAGLKGDRGNSRRPSLHAYFATALLFRRKTCRPINSRRGFGRMT